MQRIGISKEKMEIGCSPHDLWIHHRNDDLTQYISECIVAGLGQVVQTDALGRNLSVTFPDCMGRKTLLAMIATCHLERLRL